MKKKYKNKPALIIAALTLVVVVIFSIVYYGLFSVKTNGPFGGINVENLDFGNGNKDFVISKDTSLSSGKYDYKSFVIESGVLTVSEKGKGSLVIRASKSIVIKKEGSIDLSGLGYKGAVAENEPNEKRGINFDFAGGGGSHGGKGGAGSCNSKEYIDVFGQNSLDVSFGMGGGKGVKIHDGKGGNGGGYIKLIAPEIIIEGKIILDGKDGEKTGGGGAGGKLVILSGKFVLTGTISANGGAGGTSQFQGAGGGGGGVVMMIDQTSTENISTKGGGAGKAIDYYSGCHGEDGFDGLVLFRQGT